MARLSQKHHISSREFRTLVALIEKRHKEVINHITKKTLKIMAKQSELAQELAAITAQIAKIGTEVTATLQKVADLEAALANQDAVSPELQAAFDALKTQVTVVDDLIPDAA